MSEEKRTISAEVKLGLNTQSVQSSADAVKASTDKAKQSFKELSAEAIKTTDKVGKEMERLGATVDKVMSKKPRKAWAESMDEFIAKVSPYEREFQRLEARLNDIDRILQTTSVDSGKLEKAVTVVQERFSKLGFAVNITTDSIVKHRGAMRDVITEAQAISEAQKKATSAVDTTSAAYIRSTNAMKEMLTQMAVTSRQMNDAKFGTLSERMQGAQGALSKAALANAQAGIQDMLALEKAGDRTIKKYDEVGARLKELAADESRVAKMNALGMISDSDAKAAFAGINAEFDKLSNKASEPAQRMSAAFRQSTLETIKMLQEMEAAETRARFAGSNPMAQYGLNKASLSPSQLQNAATGIAEIENAQRLIDKYDTMGKKLKELRAEEDQLRALRAKGFIDPAHADRAISGIVMQRDSLYKLNAAYDQTRQAAASTYMQQQVLNAAFVNTFQSIAAGQPIMSTLFIQGTQTIGVFRGLSLATLGIATGMLVAGAAVAAFAGATAQIGDQANIARGRLKALVNDSTAAENVFKGLQELSLKTGVSAAESATVFGRFNEGAKQVGATRNETLRLVETVQKLGIVSGATAQETVSGMRQLGQALGSGRLQGDEMRSVLENIPQVGRAIAESLGVSIDELRSMGAEGKVTSDKVFKALLQYADEADRRFAAMPLTMERAWEILGRSTERFFVRVNDATGLSQKLANVIKGAADFMVNITDTLFPDAVAKMKQLQAEQARLLQQRNNVQAQSSVKFDDPREQAAADAIAKARGFAGQATQAYVTILNQATTAAHHTALATLRHADALAVEELSVKSTSDELRSYIEWKKKANKALAEEYAEGQQSVWMMEYLQKAVNAGKEAQNIFGFSAEFAKNKLFELRQEVNLSSEAFKQLTANTQGAAAFDKFIADQDKIIKAAGKGKDAMQQLQRENQAKTMADNVMKGLAASTEYNAQDRKEMWLQAYNKALKALNVQYSELHPKVVKTDGALRSLSNAEDRANDALTRLHADTMSEAEKVQAKYEQQIREVTQALDRSKLSTEQKTAALAALKKLQDEMAPSMERAAEAAEREANAYIKNLEVQVAKAGGKNTDGIELQLKREADLTSRAAEARRKAIAAYGDNSVKIEEMVSQAKRLTEAEYEAAKQQLAIKRELEGPMGKAFKDFADGMSDGLKDAFYKGFKSGENGFKGLLNGFKASFTRMLSDLAFTAIAKPIIMPVVSAVGSSIFGLSQGAINQAMGVQGQSAEGGLMGTVQNTLFSKGASWAMDKLGIGGAGGVSGMIDSLGYSVLGIGQPATMLAGQSVLTPSATVLAQQTAMLQAANPGLAVTAAPTVTAGSSGGAAGGVAAGTGLSAYLGAAGAGAFGGSIGGMLGTATNSKAVGGLSGAALGAGSAYLSYLALGTMGGPIGLAIGAIVGGVMGLLGTQKATVGPNSSGNIVLNGSGGFRTDTALADNGADAGQMQQLTNAVSTSMNTILSGINAKVTGGDGLNTGLFQYFAKDNKYYVTPQQGENAGKRKEFTSQDEAIVYYMKTSLQGLIASGNATGVSADVQTALKNTKATKAEDLANDLDFANKFQLTIKTMTNSLKYEDDARKAGADSAATLTKQITDFKSKTKDLGLDVNAANKATRTWVDGLISATEIKPYTDLEKQVVSLQANWDNMTSVLIEVGYTATEAGIKVKEGFTNNLKKLQDEAKKVYESGLNDINGRGYINDLQKSKDSYEANVRDGKALQLGNVYADAIYRQQIVNSLKGLSARELDDVSATFGGYISDLAQQVKKGLITLVSPEELQKANEDLNVRALRAEGKSQIADMAEFTFKQQNELNEALKAGYGAVYITGLKYAQGLELIAQRETQAFNAAKNLADIQSRQLALQNNNNNAANLLNFDMTAIEQIRSAQAGGGNVAYLMQVLAAERSQTAFNDARTDYITAIDRQIKVIQDQNTLLEENTTRLVELKTSLKQAVKDFLTSSDSPLAPGAKLAEARSQFEQAFADYNNTSLTADQRYAAGNKLESLGQNLIGIAKTYFASSSTTDINRVLEVWNLVGDSTTDGVNVAKETLDQNKRQLDTLQKLKDQANELGQKQLGSLDSLKTSMDTAFRTMTGYIGQLPTNNSGTTYDQLLQGVTTKAGFDSIVQYGRSTNNATLLTKAFTHANNLGLYYGNYSYQSPTDVHNAVDSRWDQQATDASLAWSRQYGYSGGYDAGFNIWLQANNKGSDFANWLRQYSQTRGWMRNGGIVGAFQSGGVVGNGLWDQDSVLAQYASGGYIALAGGEGVLNARATQAIGRSSVDYINTTGRLPGDNGEAYRQASAEVCRAIFELTSVTRTMLRLMDEIGEATVEKLEEIAGNTERMAEDTRKYTV